MTMKEFCNIHLNKNLKATLNEKSSQNQSEWKELQDTKISLHYRTFAMPMAPGRNLHADADLLEYQIKWMFDAVTAEQVFPSMKIADKLYRRVILEQLSSGHILQASPTTVVERQDLRGFNIRDFIVCYNENGTTKKEEEVGDSGSVLIGFGHQLEYGVLVGFMSNAARQQGGEFCCIIKKNRERICNVPTDLFQCQHSIRVCFVEKEVVDLRYADFGVMMEVPFTGSLPVGKRTPHIYVPKGKSEFVRGDIPTNALRHFHDLEQPVRALKRTAAVLIRNYLAAGPLKSIDTFTTHEAASIPAFFEVARSKRARAEPSTPPVCARTAPFAPISEPLRASWEEGDRGGQGCECSPRRRARWRRR